MTEDRRSAREIQRDIERTRSEMGGTIDAIQDRFSPGQVMDQVVDYFRGQTGAGSGIGEFGSNLGRVIRNNPIPIALLGIGVGWLLLGGGPSSGRLRRRSRTLYDRGRGLYGGERDLDGYDYDDYDDYDEWDDDDELLLDEEDVILAEDYSDPEFGTTDDILARGSATRTGTIYGPSGEPARTVRVGGDTNTAGGGAGFGAAAGTRASEAAERARAAARSAAGSTSEGLSGAATAAQERTSSGAQRAGGALSGAGGSVRERARDASERARQAAGTARERAAHAGEGARHAAAELGAAAYERYAGARARMGEMVEDAEDWMRTEAESLRRGIGRAGARARSGMTSAQYRARYGAGRAREGAGRMLQEQPLAVAAVGFVVGVALGALLPSTRREDEWLGGTRDELKHGAERAVREEARRAQAVATSAARAAQDEASRQGLSAEGMTGALGSVADRVSRVAEAASEEADRQGFSQRGAADALKAAEDRAKRVGGAAAEEADRQGLSRRGVEEGLHAAEDKVKRVAEAAREAGERTAKGESSKGESPRGESSTGPASPSTPAGGRTPGSSS